MSCMYVFPFDFSRWFCSHVSWHWWGALLETRSKVFENRQTPKRRCDEMYILPTVEFQGLLPRKFNDWNPKNDAVLNPESPCPLHLLRGKIQSEQTFYRRIHRLSNVQNPGSVGFMTPSGPPRSTLFCNGHLVGCTTHGGWLGIRGEVWRSTPGEEGDSTLSRVLVFWVVVSNMFNVHPFLGKILILTNIFQVGWNHQVGFVWIYQRASWQNLGEFWGSEDIFVWEKSTHKHCGISRRLSFNMFFIFFGGSHLRHFL